MFRHFDFTDKSKIGFLFLSLIFLGILLVFRRLIKYPFCDLESYSGKYGRGISNYYFIIHMIVSLGLTIACLFLFSDNRAVNDFFQNTVFRFGAIFLIWMLWALGIGYLIELYLEKTDVEYKQWKKEQ